MSNRRTLFWTFLVTSLAAFMVALDNLVVTTALPSIRTSLDTGLEQLEWTVNAYTLTFGVLLLTGAALGERFGRRRVLAAGLTLFTAASALAALAPSADWLVAARGLQGVGAALVFPLTLTLLSAAVSPERRGAALGVWGAVTGLAVAMGPLVGGAVVEGLAWQWIFWLNVPIGIALIPLILRRLDHSLGVPRPLDVPGLVLASVGLFGLVYALVKANALGWTSTTVLTSASLGVVALGAFVAWERRTRTPMIPLQMFGSRQFSVANAVTLAFSFGMFGSIFLLAQFLQTVQGSSPFEAGLKTLPWTAMPLLVAPLAGPLSDRIGGRPLLVTGLSLQAIGLAWLGVNLTVSVSYATLVPAFVVSGIGMGLVFAPLANVVLGGVRRELEGVASGTNGSVREIGGAFGVAVLASVFAGQGGYGEAQEFVDGIVPAILVGAGVVAVGAVLALALPGRPAASPAAAPRSVPESVRGSVAESAARVVPALEPTVTA